MNIATTVARLADVDAVSLTPLPRGRNSSVYHATLPDGRELAVKHYPPAEAGRPDRLQAEVDGLDFLATQGVDCVPRPLACSEQQRIALFSWVEGAPPTTIGQQEIDAAVDFLTRLHTLRLCTNAQQLPLACEAVLSGAALERQLTMRMERLRQVPELANFLSNTFQPARDMLGARAQQHYRDQGLLFSTELAPEQRTLSPSDFGFHNALRDAQGRLYFVDFEYFGWDDPVKLVADFLWHPAMSLSKPLKKGFVEKMRTLYHHDHGFEARLEALYPLYGLRWCMILLNEFLPQGRAKRAHASAMSNEDGEDEWTEVKQRQLKRARRLLDEILRTYERFPY